MTLVVPDVGEVLALKYIVNKSSPADLKLHLFKNNVTPGESDTVSTYTENTETGYAAVTLTGASWTVSTVSGVTTASYPQVTFNFTAAATSYGYFITDNSGLVLMWVEKFGVAASVPNGGGPISVIVNVTLD